MHAHFTYQPSVCNEVTNYENIYYKCVQGGYSILYIYNARFRTERIITVINKNMSVTISHYSAPIFDCDHFIVSRVIW